MYYYNKKLRTFYADDYLVLLDVVVRGHIIIKGHCVKINIIRRIHYIMCSGVHIMHLRVKGAVSASEKIRVKENSCSAICISIPTFVFHAETNLEHIYIYILL